MRILIEGEPYSLTLLESILSEKLFTKDKDNNLGRITYVGYYYVGESNELIYILPKVFIDEKGIVLYRFHKDELSDTNFLSSQDIDAVFFDRLHKAILYFYKSLLEYKKRNLTKIINKDNTSTIEKNIGSHS